jgi:cytoskeletal protein CcmA (bactofilin family)
MFHRPKTTHTTDTQPSSNSAAAALNNDAAEAQTDVKSVMKSPASFLQTQQTVATKDATQDSTDNKTQKEEIKTMDVKEDKNESTSEVAAPAAARTMNPAYSAGNTSYNAGSTFGSTASTPSANYDRDTGRKLVVGQGINMSGEIDSCDHLIVEGTVEAALKGAEILDIYENGTFFGTVEIQEATIAGKFEGDLIVHGRLTLLKSAEVSGTLAYGELSVEAGAQMQGMIRPTSSVAEETSSPAKKKSVKKLKAANNAASEADTQLPFASDAATA